jgi:hypothetical protein
VHGKVQIEDVQRSVDKVLGLKGKVHVLKNSESNDFGGQDVLMSDYSEKISALTLEIDTNKKFLKFPDLVAIVHEFQHVVDKLFHPKYLSRYQYMCVNDLYTTKYDSMFEELFYHRIAAKGNKNKKKILKRVEFKFRKFLKSIPPAFRVNYLQDLRYSIMSEDAACKTQLKYARALNKKHHPVIKRDLEDESKQYLYKEKLQIIDRVAAETLMKERYRVAKARKIKKNKKSGSA